MPGFRLRSGKIAGGYMPGVRADQSKGAERPGEPEISVSEGAKEVDATREAISSASGAEEGATVARDPTGSKKRPVKVSFMLDRALHTRLKLEAVRRGETIVGMVSRWIEETTAAA